MTLEMRFGRLIRTASNRGVVEREEAAIGVFITLEEPSKDMTIEAVSAGYYKQGETGKQSFGQKWKKDVPKIQILTIDDLLNGKNIEMPPSAYGTFKQAEKVKKKEGKQDELGI